MDVSEDSARTSLVDRVGTDNDKSDGPARGSRKQHLTDLYSLSGFCVKLPDDGVIFSARGCFHETPVVAKLTNVTNSRSSVKFPEQKLKDKMENQLIRENCMDITALNEEIVEKGNLDRKVKSKMVKPYIYMFSETQSRS